MSKYNLYKAITLAGRLAERATKHPVSIEEAEALDVILELISKIKEYENAEQVIKKAPDVSSISISTRDNTLPCWSGINPISATYTTSNLGYPKNS